MSYQPGPNDAESSGVIQARNLGPGSQPLHSGRGNMNVMTAGGTLQHIEHYHVNGPQAERQSNTSLGDWLKSQSSPFYNHSFSRHIMLRDQRMWGTCRWILEHTDFKQWIQNKEETSQLWVQGILGSGKSVLAFVIDYLRELVNHNDNEACIFFYFEDDKSIKPTISQILAVLLQQLVQDKQGKGGKIAERLATKHDEYQAIGHEAPPTAEEYSDLLNAQAAVFSRVYMVVDSLESCGDSITEATQMKMLQTIQKLPSNVNLIFTTRSGTPIGRQIQLKGGRNHLSISVPNPVDIRLFVEGHIENNVNLQRIIGEGQQSNPNFEKEVFACIQDGSKDMFTLATLMMNNLCKQGTLGEFRSSMRERPGNGSSAFDTVIKRIQHQDTRELEFAKFVLTCLMYAARPLTVNELVHSFTLQSTGKTSNREYDLSEDHLAVCKGLVVVESRSNSKFVRIIHESVHSDLETQKLVHESPHEFMARLCLKYLLSDDFNDAVSSVDALKRRREEFAFLDYAATNFVKHLHRSGESISPETEAQVMRLLRHSKKLRSCFQILLMSPEARTNSVPAAIFLNLPAFAEKLINEGIDVDSTFENGPTALHWAARLGKTASIQLLLRHKARLDRKDMLGNTPLHKAVINEHTSDASRHRSVIKQLVVADPGTMNIKNKAGFTAFQWAIQYSPFWVAELLAEHQPETNIRVTRDQPDSPLRDVMRHVPSSEKARIARALLRKGAILNEAAFDGWHPLVDAAEYGEPELVKLLIGHGSPIEIRNGGGYTPLRQALLYEHFSLVQLLVAHKADVDSRTRDGCTLLIEAVKEDRAPAVWWLLENGAKPSEQDKTGSTSLHWAVQRRSSSLVWLLLAKKASVHIRDSTGMSAIDLAARDGQFALVWLLLDQGASAEENSIKSHQGLSTLHHAAIRGHGNIVTLLLSKGADINARDQAGMTALVHATRQKDERMVKLLLQKGALPDIQDNYGATALHHATRSMCLVTERVRLMLILLRAEADPNVQDNFKKTPLMIAAEGGLGTEVYTLLDHGASTRLRNGEGHTARDLAEARGFTEIMADMDDHPGPKFLAQAASENLV